MSLFKKILTHSFWVLIGNSVGKLAMFLTSIVAARILPQETFGQFTMIRNTISSIESIVTLGLRSSAIKQISEVSHLEQNKINSVITAILTTNIIIATILSLILALSTPSLIEKIFFSHAQIKDAFYIGIVLLIVSVLSNLMQTILTGFEEFKRLAFSGMISSTASLPMIILLIYFFELYGALFGTIFYFTIDFFIKFKQLKFKNILPNYDFSLVLEDAKNFLSFSSPLIISLIITTSSFWYARVLIVNHSGKFTEIAIFDAAFQWLTIIMLITGATTNVALPMLSKAMKKNNQKELSQLFWYHLSINVAISIIMAVAFSTFSKNIMSIYGPSYVSGENTLIILCFASVFYTISSLLNKSIIVKGKSNSVLFNSIVSSIILFVTLYFFINKHQNALSIAILSFYITSSITYILTIKVDRK